MTSPANRERLRSLIESKCLLRGREFTLSTGAQSGFYFDLKAATLDGECLNLIVDEVLERIYLLPEIPTAIGGLTIGADFVTSAVVAQAYRVGHPTVSGSIVRKEPKKHGTRNKIENELPEGTKIVVIDDVITTGRSIRDACNEFREAGYQIVGIIALVDRQTGGKEALESEFGTVITLFNLSDFETLTNKRAAEHGQTPVAASA